MKQSFPFGLCLTVVCVGSFLKAATQKNETPLSDRKMQLFSSLRERWFEVQRGTNTNIFFEIPSNQYLKLLRPYRNKCPHPHSKKGHLVCMPEEGIRNSGLFELRNI